MVPGHNDSASSLRVINRGLGVQGFSDIAAADFASVHISRLLTSGRLRTSPLLAARQVRNYVTDNAVRTRAMETVAGVIAPETRMVIAHSLGTVAAYEALCLLPRHQVRSLITLGSPLGIPWGMRWRLNAFSAFGRHEWPRSVLHWANFYDQRDLIACRPLRSFFGGGKQVDDVPVDLASNNQHLLTSYLSAAEVVATIAAATSPEA
jgi:pimeloyl-ACP methyl ester carboxylesterase